jgi:hypothetical protein
MIEEFGPNTLTNVILQKVFRKFKISTATVNGWIVAVKKGWEDDNVSSMTTNVVLLKEIKELRSEISELKKEAIKSHALQSDILTLLQSMNLGTGGSDNGVIVQVSNGEDLGIIVNTANSDDIVDDSVIEPFSGGRDLDNGAGVICDFDCVNINDESLDGIPFDSDAEFDSGSGAGAAGASNSFSLIVSTNRSIGAGVNGGIDGAGVDVNDESLDGIPFDSGTEGGSGAGAANSISLSVSTDRASGAGSSGSSTGAANSLSLSVSTDHASGAGNSTVTSIKRGRGKGKNNKPKAQNKQKPQGNHHVCDMLDCAIINMFYCILMIYLSA